MQEVDGRAWSWIHIPLLFWQHKNQQSLLDWILLAFFQSSTVSEAKATKCSGIERANKPKKYPQMALFSSSQCHVHDVINKLYILQSVFSTCILYFVSFWLPVNVHSSWDIKRSVLSSVFLLDFTLLTFKILRSRTCHSFLVLTFLVIKDRLESHCSIPLHPFCGTKWQLPKILVGKWWRQQIQHWNLEGWMQHFLTLQNSVKFTCQQIRMQ